MGHKRAAVLKPGDVVNPFGDEGVVCLVEQVETERGEEIYVRWRCKGADRYYATSPKTTFVCEWYFAPRELVRTVEEGS